MLRRNLLIVNLCHMRRICFTMRPTTSSGKTRKPRLYVLAHAASTSTMKGGHCTGCGSTHTFESRGFLVVHGRNSGSAMASFALKSLFHWQWSSLLRSTAWPNKSVKPFACGSLGHSALRTCSGMASPLLPELALRAECRLPGRYTLIRAEP